MGQRVIGGSRWVGPQRPWKGAWILLRTTLYEGPWQTPTLGGNGLQGQRECRVDGEN